MDVFTAARRVGTQPSDSPMTDLTSSTLRAYVVAPFALFAASLLPAQVIVQVGGNGAYGCQGNANPPTLTGQTPASASYGFTYDAATAMLTLRVTNTSAVTQGVPNPLLTLIAFNLPAHAVTGMTLQSQVGAGGAEPDFDVTVDTDLFALPNPNKVACLGEFSVQLTNGGGIGGGIANALADTIVAPRESWVIGPVTFTFRLSGPGVHTLTAGAIANTLSQAASYKQATAAAKFQSGGQGGEESGFIGSSHKCVPSLYAVGEPRLGRSFDVCAGGAAGCVGCVLVSTNPGPTRFLQYNFQIGVPILHTFVLPPSTGGLPTCARLAVPDDPNLINLRLYFLLVIGSLAGGQLEQSERLEIVIR